MPTSCEVSTPIVGQYGWPCGLLGLRSWLGKVFAGPDRWESFVQPEPVVEHYLFFGALWLAFLVIFAFSPRWIDRERELARLKVKKCDRECEERKLEAGTPTRF